MLRRFVLLFIYVALSVQTKSQECFIEYPVGDNETIYFRAGDMSGEYNYSVGSVSDDVTGVSLPIALRVDEDCCYIDKVYAENIIKGSFCCALGLGNGDVFVVSICGDNVFDDMYEKLWMAILNPDLDVVKETYIDISESYLSYGNAVHAVVNDKNEIVVITQIADSYTLYKGVHYDYAFYKVNMECDLLKSSCLENISYYGDITDFTTIPNTDRYAVFGNGMRANNVETVFYIDDDLNYISSDFIDNPDNYPDFLFPKFMCVDHWYDENSFLMSAQSSRTSGRNQWHPLVLKMDTQMTVMDVLDLERIDTTDYVSQFKSMSYVDSSTIYISTFWFNGVMDGSSSNTATIFLINERLDLLGRKDIDMKEFLNILHIQPTPDKGCMIQAYINNGHRKRPIICKFCRSDFEIKTYVSNYDELSDVKVYPSPVSSLLNIDVDGFNGENVNVKIYDIQGRRCLDKDVVMDGNVMTIDVSLLGNGTYIYHISDKTKSVQNVFIKE